MLCLLILLAFSLQGCLGIGDGGNGVNNNDFQTHQTKPGESIGINKTDQAVFKGKIYFTLGRKLYVLDGARNLTPLTDGFDVRDPAISPDGKTVAFIIRYKNYADLAMMPATGGKMTVLRSGNGQFIHNPNSPMGAPISTAYWYAQPTWQDNKHLAFLSDWGKTYINPGVDNFMLDPQIFLVSLENPRAQPKEVAYATYGDGGNRDPSFRPNHPNQIIYTNFQYDTTSFTKQVVQIYLEDANAIANHPGVYRPGTAGREFDPAVALTPSTPDLVNMQPAFSPDGNSLAYVRNLDATHMGLFIMPVPDNVVQNPNDPQVKRKALLPYNQSARLVTAQFLGQPVWSADGTQIVYMGFSNNVFNLWLANVTKDAQTGAYKLKGDPVQLTNASAGQLDADSRPFWAV